MTKGDWRGGEGYLISKGREISFRCGRGGLMFKKTQKGKRTLRKQVPEINREEARGFKKIGTAQGMNLFHCVYLCAKNTQDFYERICAYSIGTPNRRFSARVTFYEKK